MYLPVVWIVIENDTDLLKILGFVRAYTAQCSVLFGTKKISCPIFIYTSLSHYDEHEHFKVIWQFDTKAKWIW